QRRWRSAVWIGSASDVRNPALAERRDATWNLIVAVGRVDGDERVVALVANAHLPLVRAVEHEQHGRRVVASVARLPAGIDGAGGGASEAAVIDVDRVAAAGWFAVLSRRWRFDQRQAIRLNARHNIVAAQEKRLARAVERRQIDEGAGLIAARRADRQFAPLI